MCLFIRSAINVPVCTALSAPSSADDGTFHLGNPLGGNRRPEGNKGL